MLKLIKLELKKYILNRNNYILLMVLGLLLAGFIYMKNQQNMAANYQLREDINYNLNLQQSALPRLRQELLAMPENKQLQKIITSSELDVQLLTQIKTALLLEDWNLYLENKIQYDEKMAQEISSGMITTSLSADEARKDVEINKLLLEQNIEPIFTENSMQALNYMTVVLNSLFVILVLVLVIYFTSSLIPSDFESDTYKFLYTQPMSKTKIFFSKFISALIINYSWVLLVLGISFLSLIPVFGLGNKEYPFTLVLGETTSTIPVSQFIFIALFVLFLLVALAIVFTLLISIFIHSSSATLIIGLLLTLILCLGGDQMKNFIQYNPFAYYRITDAITGQLAFSYENSAINLNSIYLLAPILSIVGVLANTISFKKMRIK